MIFLSWLKQMILRIRSHRLIGAGRKANMNFVLIIHTTVIDNRRNTYSTLSVHFTIISFKRFPQLRKVHNGIKRFFLLYKINYFLEFSRGSKGRVRRNKGRRAIDQWRVEFIYNVLFFLFIFKCWYRSNRDTYWISRREVEFKKLADVCVSP